MDTDDMPRKRAPRRSLTERREMVVQAAIPLLVELGAAVTTLQIARAAGISEPTIFRAFADKNELLLACLAEATDPRHVLDGLAAIEPELCLRERLHAVIEVLRMQGERSGAVVHAVGAVVRHPEPTALPGDEQARLADSRTSAFQRLHDAVCAVFEPDVDALRLPVAEVATHVLAIVLALGRGGGWDTGTASITTDGLADVLLHGITA